MQHVFKFGITPDILSVVPTERSTPSLVVIHQARNNSNYGIEWVFYASLTYISCREYQAYGCSQRQSPLPFFLYFALNVATWGLHFLKVCCTFHLKGLLALNCLSFCCDASWANQVCKVWVKWCSRLYDHCIRSSLSDQPDWLT